MNEEKLQKRFDAIEEQIALLMKEIKSNKISMNKTFSNIADDLGEIYINTRKENNESN